MTLPHLYGSFLSCIARKPAFGVSDQVRHKQGCTITEDGSSLEISDFGSKGILYYLCSENKGADQLRGYREADLRLCFCICEFAKSRFSHDTVHIAARLSKMNF